MKLLLMSWGRVGSNLLIDLIGQGMDPCNRVYTKHSVFDLLFVNHQQGRSVLLQRK